MNSSKFDDLITGWPSECWLCPRECRADRSSPNPGYCRTGDGFEIASICIHKGEEPVIGGSKGICNIFFYGCNLRCVYCQNHEISHIPVKQISQGQKKGKLEKLHLPVREMQLPDVLDQVELALDQGLNSVGFVTPSHVVPQVLAIIRGLHERGRKPRFVWNSNAFEKPEILRSLEGIIDVYLPDFKYSDPLLSAALSDAPRYPEIALAAIREMYRQKGSVVITDESGQAESGLVIRHLVLPGQVENSLGVLRAIADEISTGVYISLMAQYHPTPLVQGITNLNRTLYRDEYERVREELELLGFRKGYVQELDSANIYRPDFNKDHPFETK
ncbi:MAG: radical SAM protein [Bacteroidales bacterium]